MIKSEMNIELAIRYITGSASDAERMSFDSWLIESDNHRDQFNAFRSYWNITGSSYDNYEPDLLRGWDIVSRETVHKKVVPFRQKSVSIRILKITAAVLLLLAGWYGGRLVINKAGLPESQLFVYSTSDNIKKLQLRDGTFIWLNKNSEVKIPSNFNKHKRSINLEGEAYFEVAPNKNKPFTILAGNTFTKVVGTSFNLRAYSHENKIRITVFTGIVAFTATDNKTVNNVLMAGDRGIYRNDTKELWKELTLEPNDLAWKTGTLHFKNAPLEEVCEVLSDYYNISIEIDPEIAKSKYFTGKFQKASLNEMLDIIELTLDVHFLKKDNRILAKP
jgi:transmembrane sensor